MEPPVVSIGQPEGHFFILIIIFPNIDMKSVRGKVVKGAAGDFWFFPTGLSFLQVSIFHHFFFDLYQVFFFPCNIQSCADGFQMFDFLFCFLDLVSQGFVGTFQLIIFVKMLLGIFFCGKLGIQRNTDIFARIVIGTGKRFFPALKTIAVSVKKFSVYFIFFPFFRIFQLLFLQVIFFIIPFQGRLYHFSEIHGFLLDSGNSTSGRIKMLQKRTDGFIRMCLEFSALIAGKGNTGKFYGFLIVGYHIGRKVSFFYIFHKPYHSMTQMGQLWLCQVGGRQVSINRCQMAQFHTHDRAEAGEFLINCFLDWRSGRKKQISQSCFRYLERVTFFHSLGNKVRTSRQYFPDRTELGGNMFDTVQNRSIFPAEDNVTVFSHNLHHQFFAAEIPKFI